MRKAVEDLERYVDTQAVREARLDVALAEAYLGGRGIAIGRKRVT